MYVDNLLCLALAWNSLVLSSPYLIHSILLCCYISDMLEDTMSIYFFFRSCSCWIRWALQLSSASKLYREVSSHLAASGCALRSAKWCLFSFINLVLSLSKKIFNCCILGRVACEEGMVDTRWSKSLCLIHISQNWNLAIGLGDDENCINSGVWSERLLGK